jgi:hypothetical protein
VSEQAEVNAEPMTKDEQIDYWQERFFAEQDEKAALLNQVLEIQRILAAPPDKETP